MEHFAFISYMKNVAEKLKELKHTESDKHFQRASSMMKMEEFLANTSHSNGFQLVVIAHESGKYIDKNSDNLLDQPFYSFYVVKTVEQGNYDAKDQVITDCKTVAKKILSKMFKDKRESQNGLNYLDRGSIAYAQAGPFAQNWFGISYSFTLLDPSDIVYNASDWDE